MSKKLIVKTLLFILSISFAYGKDPLPSWNDGPIKASIIKYVQEVTQKDGLNFIPLEDRIATFDEDGTLWVEQPVYTEFYYCMDVIKQQASKHPEWQDKEPFKSIIAGNLDFLKNISKEEIKQVIAISHAGMTVEDFEKDVRAWLKTAIHPRFKRPFTQLIYLPMVEVMRLLRDNDFKIYIVSGGGQDFIRSFAKTVYGISPEFVIGTTTKVKYEYRDAEPVLVKTDEILFIDDKAGKPQGIHWIIGKRPVAAFGNSTGDQQMLEWTQGNKMLNFELLVHHDDAEREYAYGPDSKIGTFSDELMNEANKKGWFVVSMKNDWKVIFAQD